VWARHAVVGVLVALSAWSAYATKRAMTTTAPALAVVDRASVEPAPVETVAASVERAPASIIVVEHTPDLAQHATQPTRWTGDDGVVYERAPEGYERYYNGRPLVRVRTIWMTTTAYSPDHRSCGKWADGWTASMKSVWTNGMELVAADRRVLDFGTLVSVPGYAGGRAVPVLDVGGAIKGARLDLLYPSHNVALKWGVQRLPVTVWAYAVEDEDD